MATKIKTLECSCCGNLTRGRQWWNRDTGYGICPKCVDWMRNRNVPLKEMEENYGTVGVHYNVK